MRLFFIITIIFGLFSCHNVKEKSDANNQLTALKNLIDTINYKNTWINKGYYDQLSNLKSHAKLWDKFEISFIGVAPNEHDLILVKDFHVGYGYSQAKVNNELLLVPDEPLESDTLTINWVEIGKSFSIGIDTLIKTEILDPNNILETLLYSGNYSFNGKTVEFRSNGQIKNLDDFVFLIPEYSDKNIDGYDMIRLKEDMKTPELFTAEFLNDTLNIYEFNCRNHDEYELNCLKGDRGKLKYQLIKK